MFVAHVRILIVWYATSLALGSAISLGNQAVLGGRSLDEGVGGVDRVLMGRFFPDSKLRKLENYWDLGNYSMYVYSIM